MLSSIYNGLAFAGEIEVIVIRIAIMLCDLIGIAVILTTVGKGLVHYFHHEKDVKLILAQGIGLALEFKLAGEVLRTVTVRELNELAILGTIIVLRGAITLLVHWEIKAEKAEAEYEYELKKKRLED